MSIASIKQARDAKYQRIVFDPAAQSQWANENYYELDSILVSEREVNFNFDQDTPKELFPLINQPRQPNIPPRGVSLSTKIWQLPALRYCGNLIIPDDYKPAVIESFRAGSNVAKLTEKRDLFYEKGCAVSRYLQPPEAERLSNELLNTLLHRAKSIFLRTLDQQLTSNLKFSKLELCVYDKGYYTEQRLKSWKKDVPRRKQKCERKFRRYA